MPYEGAKFAGPCETPTRPALRYHGGKFRLRRWVLDSLPPHRVYVEPFCGAASVLLAKPRCYSEVINDLDDEIVSLFSVLRDPEAAADLAAALRLTPFARAEFLASYRPVPADWRGDKGVERARRLIVRAFMGFGSAASQSAYITGFRASSDRSGTTPAHDWMHYPDVLGAVTARLQGVIVENRPALDVIRLHDAPDALFYVDPPYVMSTRRYKRRATGQVYAHEMYDDDHRALAEALHSVAGMVVLSGYPCALYEELYAGWERRTRAAYADGARRRTECLWLNARAGHRAAQTRLVFPSEAARA